MYLRDRKDAKEEERYRKNQQSHISNAILQQTIPFCFKNAWYYYREAMSMFSNKLTKKKYYHSQEQCSLFQNKYNKTQRGITEALLKLYYLKTMFYQNRFGFKSVNSITVSSGNAVANKELYSRDKYRRQKTEVTTNTEGRSPTQTGCRSTGNHCSN